MIVVPISQCNLDIYHQYCRVVVVVMPVERWIARRQEARGSRCCLSILGCGRPKYPRYPNYTFDDGGGTRTASVKSAANDDIVELLAAVHADESSTRKASVGIKVPVCQSSQWS